MVQGNSHPHPINSIYLLGVDSTSNPPPPPPLLYFFYFVSQQDRPLFGAGVSLYLGQNQPPICLVAAVLAFLSRHSPVQGPLFVHQDGSPLTRTQLVTAIRSALQMAGCDCSGFSGHSFLHWCGDHCSSCRPSKLTDSDIGQLEVILLFNPLIAILFQQNLASKKRKQEFVEFERGTRDCGFGALPTWLIQHTGVQCNI